MIAVNALASMDIAALNVLIYLVISAVTTVRNWMAGVIVSLIRNRLSVAVSIGGRIVCIVRQSPIPILLLQQHYV